MDSESLLPEGALVERVRGALSHEVFVPADGLPAEVALLGPTPPTRDLVATVLWKKKLVEDIQIFKMPQSYF